MQVATNINMFMHAEGKEMVVMVVMMLEAVDCHRNSTMSNKRNKRIVSPLMQHPDNVILNAQLWLIFTRNSLYWAFRIQT